MQTKSKHKLHGLKGMRYTNSRLLQQIKLGLYLTLKCNMVYLSLNINLFGVVLLYRNITSIRHDGIKILYWNR